VKFQKRLLNAIINHQRLDLMTDNVPALFFDWHSKEILRACYELVALKKDVTVDTLKACLSGKKYNSLVKESLYSRINDVTREHILVSENLLSELRREYEAFEIENAKMTLAREDEPIEVKVDALVKTANRLTKAEDNGFEKLTEVVKQNLRLAEEGLPSKFFERAIEINDPKLRILMGPYLYPQPICWIARPGDYKTSFLINLQEYLINAGHMGIHITLEDSIEGYTMKYMACALRLDKDEMAQNRARHQDMAPILSRLNEEMIITAKANTANKIRKLVDQSFNRYNIRWISLDYLGLLTGDSRMNREEKLEHATTVFMEISREYNVPFIYLSQVDKESNKNAPILKASMAFGSQSIQNASRVMVSFNPVQADDVPDSPYRLWHDCKKTFGVKRDWTVTFHPPSGKIDKVEKVMK